MGEFTYERRLPNLNHHAPVLVQRCQEKVQLERCRLLPQQIKALHNVKVALSRPVDPEEIQHITLVSMPTGSGKTGVIACLPYYLATIPKSPGSQDPRYPFDKPILVIAPGLDILNQLQQELTVIDANNKLPFLIRTKIVPREVQADVLPKSLVIKRTSELRTEQYLETFEIVITNAQKFHGKNWEDDFSNDLFRLVIVDEAHHYPAPTWRRIVEKFRNPNCPVVFFTATPFRTDGKRVLPELRIAYHLRLSDAVEAGIIRRARFQELSEIHFRDDNYEDFMADGDELTAEQMDDFDRMIPILRKVHELLEEKRAAVPDVPHMAIAITRDQHYAERLLELWQTYHGEEQAECYHSDKPANEKAEIIRRIKNNELSLVIVVAMLLEGFDHPPISIAAITYSMKSPLRFVQFTGRAQRIYRKVGYIDRLPADIVTHKDYNQKRNYDNFVNEALIPGTDAEKVDD